MITRIVIMAQHLPVVDFRKNGATGDSARRCSARENKRVAPTARWHRGCSAFETEEPPMATRRRATIPMPDPTSLTETAIDAGVRAVETTAAIARGLARGAMTAARAMSQGASEATDDTTRTAERVARDTGERARRAAPRATPRRARPARAARKSSRRRRRAA
jgi:hypothetical protein